MHSIRSQSLPGRSPGQTGSRWPADADPRET